MSWAEHVARMRDRQGAYRILVGRIQGKRPPRRPRIRWDNNIKLNLHSKKGRGMDLSGSRREMADCQEHDTASQGSITCRVFPEQLQSHWLLKNSHAAWSYESWNYRRKAVMPARSCSVTADMLTGQLPNHKSELNTKYNYQSKTQQKLLYYVLQLHVSALFFRPSSGCIHQALRVMYPIYKYTTLMMRSQSITCFGPFLQAIFRLYTLGLESNVSYIQIYYIDDEISVNYMFRPFSLGHLQVVYTRP